MRCYINFFNPRKNCTFEIDTCKFSIQVRPNRYFIELSRHLNSDTYNCKLDIFHTLTPTFSAFSRLY